MGQKRSMKPFRVLGPLVCAVIATFTSISIRAADPNPAPPTITTDRTTNGQPRLVFPYPAAQQYNVFSAGNVTNTLAPDVNSGKLLGPTFIVTNGGAMRFYKVTATPMSSNDIFAANILNRLTYGPTPDDIARIQSIGPQAFLNELMSWETVSETMDTDPPVTNTVPTPPPLTNWIRVTASGPSAGNYIGIYLTNSGTIYIDNVSVVTGLVAEAGVNLLTNGDFENPVLNPPWTNGTQVRATIPTNSPTVDGLAASGTNCVRLTCNGASGAINTSFHQTFLPTNPPSSMRFTLTFYYLPVQQTNPVDLVVRLGGVSGSSTTGRVSIVNVPPPPPAPPAINVAYSKLMNTNSDLDDLRAWHVYRAIHSKRQLHEVLSQFFMNHFTTQYQKTRDYYDNNYNVSTYTNDAIREAVSVDLHWREYKKFRDALMDPNCTFYDLLKISIESEAMIIYLDTQLNSKAAANQNYAREIMELHTMGVDNGYVQQDIVDLSKVWTGWRVAKKTPANAGSPFTPAITGTSSNIVDTPGVWCLNFSTNNHDTTTKKLFTNGPIAARFGAALGGGNSYSLFLSNTLATGTNGFGEGYKVAQHLANLPYTMEFVSVKLCRLFVHEGFELGTYDYTSPNLSPEAQLVKDCMTAWNTPAGDSRKGNIRSVLNTIFNSALFRGHGASQQKVKTPLEFTVSAVRALRITNTDTNGYYTSTCDSDGYGISGRNGNSYPLSRMGGMGLFNKPEPDGWSEFGRIWLNTANLCERMRFAQHLLMQTSSSIKDDDYGSAGLANTSDPVALLKSKLPAASWNNDGAVVDFFLGLLYPGEGAGNLGRDREAAITFLNLNEAGSASSSFSSLSGTSYDGRVRSMVGFLMSLPRFQEQ
jgi:uncharacterized protein (DUF1800 family)